MRTFTRKFVRLVDADLEHARELSIETGRVLRSWSLSEARVQGLELAVAEMATNVCVHAYPDYPETPGTMQLSIEWSDRGLSVSISDAGRAFDPSVVPMPGTPSADNPLSWPEGGMGLMLIRSACDRLEYTRTGDQNVLAMLIDNPKQDPGAAANEARD